MNLASIGSKFYNIVETSYAAWGLPEIAVDITIAVIDLVLVVTVLMLNVLFLIWLERKVVGHAQNRYGPMRTGWHGWAQSIADAIKLLGKEDVLPQAVDRWVFLLAPIVSFAPALMVYVVVPFGNGLTVSDLNIGLIYIAALTSFTVISFLMGGWGSNNKWSLLGAMRSAAQLVSYEVPLALSVIAIAMLAGSLSLGDIIKAQQESVWFILLQPLGFLIYITAMTAELNRTPFDLPEAESELVSGYNVEYSGLRFAFFFLTEYAYLLAMSGIAVTLYFGGWSGPLLPDWVWFWIKTYAMVFFLMWVRATLPRLRVDQLMDLGWKALLPLSLLNVAVTGLFIILL